MPNGCKQRKFSTTAFIIVAVICAVTALVDASALVLASSEIRAAQAAYAVYGVAVAFTITAYFCLVYFRRELRAAVTDAIFSTRLVAKLRQYDVFERALNDYGWRSSLTAIAVLAWNIVYVSYLIWMAVAYKSPWYAALAGFYTWLVLIRGSVIAAEKYVAHANFLLPQLIKLININSSSPSCAL